jgi:hypothetical protein
LGGFGQAEPGVLVARQGHHGRAGRRGRGEAGRFLPVERHHHHVVRKGQARSRQADLGGGQKCARAGQPVGLVTADGSVYMLIDEEHDPRRDGLTTFRQFAIDNMANVVKINGTLTDVDKQKAIYVQGFVKNK